MFKKFLLRSLPCTNHQLFSNLQRNFGAATTFSPQVKLRELSASPSSIPVDFDEQIFGHHLVLNLFACDTAKIQSGDNIRNFALDLVEKIDMKAFGDPQVVHFAEHDPQAAGYTLVQLVETSAIMGHFVDESGDSFLDVFSCKDFDDLIVKEVVEKYFQPTSVESVRLLRQAPKPDVPVLNPPYLCAIHEVSLYDCDFEKIQRNDLWHKAFDSIIKNTGLTELGRDSKNFKGDNFDAVTMTAILSESHLSVHTWPEHQRAVIDLLTCQAPLGKDVDFSILTQLFGGKLNVRVRLRQ